MLISDSHKLILLLPQKCASETLQFRLQKIHDVEEFGKGLVYNAQTQKVYSKHINLKKAHKINAFTDRPDHLKACFVRNPYSRVYSWFNWLKVHTLNSIENGFEGRLLERIERNEDLVVSQRKLTGFRKNLLELEEAKFDFNTYITQHPNRFRPASTFTHYKKKPVVEFIGRIENFEEDFATLCHRIGFDEYTTESKKRTLTREDSTPQNNSHYIEFYTRKTIRLINRAFKDDFKWLGYKKH